MTMLRGVAWDHQRCWGPLENKTDIDWTRRSLFSFGEGDLGEFVLDNDFVIYDHPFAGDIARRGLMINLFDHLSSDQVAVLEANQVGGSYQSYLFEGGLYGLPIDAAAVTSAWRPDLMEQLGAAVPATLDDVIALAGVAQAAGKWVGWAAKPTDLMCSYVTMAASLGVEPGRDAGPFVSREISLQVFDFMRRLSEVVHPHSLTWNPIQLYNYMSQNDDIVYTPYAFNYVNYAAVGERSLRFSSVPKLHQAHPARGLLGGAGIGVSVHSRDPQAAVEMALRLVDPAFQAGAYVRGGGQPGMRSAWVADAANQLTNGFFWDCLPAMDAAFLRPNIPGFVSFFHDATQEITKAVTGEISHDAFWDWLAATYDELRSVNMQEMTLSA